MTTLELRSKIHKAIDSLPEDKLPNIFDYLNAIEAPSIDNEKINDFIDRVFKEDHEVLKRLAQ